MKLTLLPETLCVCRFDRQGAFPSLPSDGPFYSLTVTPGEISLVCSQDRVPEGGLVEAGWRALRVEGPLPFNLVGILAGILDPLAAQAVSVFALSTYDTDYVLVKDAQVDAAWAALEAAGYSLERA